MAGTLTPITKENFNETIAKGVTLVDFYADWCGPCRAMTPILEGLVQELSGKAVIAKLDIDANQELAAQFKVNSVPTLILFKEGKEIDRIVGVRDANAIKEFISKAG